MTCIVLALPTHARKNYGNDVLKSPRGAVDRLLVDTKRFKYQGHASYMTMQTVESDTSTVIRVAKNRIS